MDLDLVQFLETTPRECAADCRLRAEIVSLRAEMRECEAALRRDVAALRAVLRDDLAEQRAELLKWGVLYWIGQAAATAVIAAAVLRFLLP
jgi:hypothetical protein